MADITMCKGNNCSMKDSCYRHTATANEFWQSWFIVVPYEPAKQPTCDYFWNNKEMK